jgi:tRNA uridine 5-carbamoylmethylation protein Kti12
MNNGKVKKTAVTIAMDENRRMNGDRKDVILLFDESSQCYYEASLSKMLSRIRVQYEEETKALRQEFDKAIAEMREEQRKFIEDTSKMNETMLNVLKETTNHE